MDFFKLLSQISENIEEDWSEFRLTLEEYEDLYLFQNGEFHEESFVSYVYNGRRDVKYYGIALSRVDLQGKRVFAKEDYDYCVESSNYKKFEDPGEIVSVASDISRSLAKEILMYLPDIE